MKRIFALMAVIAALAGCSQKEEMAAYLFTYFNDPTHSLFTARLAFILNHKGF